MVRSAGSDPKWRLDGPTHMPVCTGNLIRVDEARESPRLTRSTRGYGLIMKTQTFTGKSKRGLYKQLFEWKSSRPDTVVKETRIDNLPVDLSRPVVGRAKISEQDFVFMRIDYEE
jgi:hypothetical protein